MPPPAAVLDRLICRSSESMEELPDDCVALMITSPPSTTRGPLKLERRGDGVSFTVDLGATDVIALRR